MKSICDTRPGQVLWAGDREFDNDTDFLQTNRPHVCGCLCAHLLAGEGAWAEVEWLERHHQLNNLENLIASIQ